MTVEYNYTSYLRSKKSVDDRAINKDVFGALRGQLNGADARIVELGAGLGTMVARLIEWRLTPRAKYVLIDVDPVLLADSRTWLTQWATQAGLQVAPADSATLRLTGANVDWTVSFVEAELGALLEAPRDELRGDLLIANAFLDLVDVPAVLPRLFSSLLVRGGLFWFSVNFDGETIFEPSHAFDDAFMRVYHRSMDQRVRYGRPAGDSRTGRHLFAHLRRAGATVLSAGASDWVVFADDAGRYPSLEARFIEHILDTIDQELRRHSEIPPAQLAEWLGVRREQLKRGELVYLAHQLDFAGRAPA